MKSLLTLTLLLITSTVYSQSLEIEHDEWKKEVSSKSEIFIINTKHEKLNWAYLGKLSYNNSVKLVEHSLYGFITSDMIVTSIDDVYIKIGDNDPVKPKYVKGRSRDFLIEFTDDQIEKIKTAKTITIRLYLPREEVDFVFTEDAVIKLSSYISEMNNYDLSN